MGRRLFVFLVVLVSAFGVLLLLSALVQTPADETEAAQELPIAHSITSFISMPPVPTYESALSVGGIWLRVAALFAAAVVILPCLACICDANGRVLCKRSYTHSYHLVFKQEFACG